MAYGSAGYDGLGNPSEVRALAEGFVDTEKFSFDWNFDALAPGESLSPGHGKLLLLMIELASEMLLRDGAIEITYAPEADFNVNYVYYAPKRLTNCIGFVFASVRENVISCGNQKVPRIV